MMALNGFVPHVITNLLKFKANLKAIFKCTCITMHPLVFSPFAHDLIKMQVDSLRYLQCFICVQYLHMQRLVFRW